MCECVSVGTPSLGAAWETYQDGRYEEALATIAPRLDTLSSAYLTASARQLVGACHFRMVQSNGRCVYIRCCNVIARH